MYTIISYPIEFYGVKGKKKKDRWMDFHSCTFSLKAIEKKLLKILNLFFFFFFFMTISFVDGVCVFISAFEILYIYLGIATGPLCVFSNKYFFNNPF